jgi:transposase-like protein
VRRKREAWPELLAQWEASGESAAEFARRIGTGAATLYRWRREFRGTTTRRHAALAKLVEVRPTVIVADGRFEVRLADGRSVGVPPSFDAEALGRLLDVLEAVR